MIRAFGDLFALLAAFFCWGLAQVAMDSRGPTRTLRAVTALCTLAMALATLDALLQIP